MQKGIYILPKRRSLFGGSTPFFLFKKEKNGGAFVSLAAVGKEGRARARRLPQNHLCKHVICEAGKTVS